VWQGLCQCQGRVSSTRNAIDQPHHQSAVMPADTLTINNCTPPPDLTTSAGKDEDSTTLASSLGRAHHPSRVEISPREQATTRTARLGRLSLHTSRTTTTAPHLIPAHPVTTVPSSHPRLCPSTCGNDGASRASCPSICDNSDNDAASPTSLHTLAGR
jgi:hypothetical protein